MNISIPFEHGSEQVRRTTIKRIKQEMAESLLAPACDFHLCHANTAVAFTKTSHTHSHTKYIYPSHVWLQKVCMVFESAFAPLNSINSRILTLVRCVMLLFTKRRQRNWLIWDVWSEHLRGIIAFPPCFFLPAFMFWLASPRPHKYPSHLPLFLFQRTVKGFW